MVAAGYVATEHSEGCQLNFSFQQVCFVASVEASTALDLSFLKYTLMPTMTYFTDKLVLHLALFPVTMWVKVSWWPPRDNVDGHLAVLSTLSSPLLVFILTNLHKILLGANTSVSDSLMLNWTKEGATNTEGSEEFLMWWKTGELAKSWLKEPAKAQACSRYWERAHGGKGRDSLNEGKDLAKRVPRDKTDG